jgi:hypothetical protein
MMIALRRRRMWASIARNASTIARLKDAWSDEHLRWSKRYLQLHQSGERQCFGELRRSSLMPLRNKGLDK